MTPPATTRAVAVHPRLRARRVAVQRAAGRRRLRRLVVLGATGSLVAAGWGVANSPLLDVDRITVAGAHHVPPADVREATGIGRGTPLFSVDAGAAERAVARLPWVAGAEVQRQWPGTVVVEITERVAVAVAEMAGGGWMVLDASGRVLEVGPADAPRPAELPVVEGGVAPATPATPGATIDDDAGRLRVLAHLPPEVAAAVTAVGQLGSTAEGTVVLRLEGGGEVHVGAVGGIDDAELDDRVLALATVLDQVDLASLARLDVSVPGSPVLTRR